MFNLQKLIEILKTLFVLIILTVFWLFFLKPTLVAKQVQVSELSLKQSQQIESQQAKIQVSDKISSIASKKPISENDNIESENNFSNQSQQAVDLPASWPVEMTLAPGAESELTMAVHQMPEVDCREVINPPYNKHDPDHLEIFVCSDPFEAAGPNSGLTVLAGHSSSIIDFKLNYLSWINLDDLLGQEIWLTTEAGHKLSYVINQTYIVEQDLAPYQAEIWQRQPGKLIIVTCQLADIGTRVVNTTANIFIVAQFKSIVD